MGFRDPGNTNKFKKRNKRYSQSKWYLGVRVLSFLSPFAVKIKRGRTDKIITRPSERQIEICAANFLALLNLLKGKV